MLGGQSNLVGPYSHVIKILVNSLDISQYLSEFVF